MNAVLLRFPHGTEYHWTRNVPEVGQVVTRGASAWIVVSRVAGELPSVVLRRHLGEPTQAVRTPSRPDRTASAVAPGRRGA